MPLNDLWEIPYLKPKAKERVGYPTQKPILLLERIIHITTDEKDLVLDPFYGNRIICITAKILNQDCIGIDISKEVVKLSKKRVNDPIKSESNLLKKGRKSYINYDEKALQLLKGIPFNPVQRNKGIDAILVELSQGKPVLVLVQKKR